MEIRNWIGLILIVIGIALQPFGWIYYYPAQIISFVLIFVGCFIFVTQKYIEKKEEEANARYLSGRGLSGDIADNSGWGRNGESHSYQNFNSDSSGDGGD